MHYSSFHLSSYNMIVYLNLTLMTDATTIATESPERNKVRNCINDFFPSPVR